MTASARAAADSLGRRIDRLPDRRFALLLFLPGALLIGLFVLPPILSVLGLATWRVELLKPGPATFAGIGNIGRMGADSDLLAAIPRTTMFALLTTAVSIPVALAAALLLDRSRRWTTVLGIALLLPWAIAPVVTGFFWRFIFHPSFGVATNVANALGLADGPVSWLQDSWTAMLVAVVATAWRSVPLLALILLAALKTIPEAQYRAARMDGAGAWATFRSITLPSLRNHLLVVGVLQLIVSLQVFDILFQLTRGGPGRETTTLSYYIYDAAFGRLSLGYAAALGVLLMLIILGCSAVLLLARLRGERSTAAPADAGPDETVGAGAPVPISRAGAAAHLAGLRSTLPAPPRGRRLRLPRRLGRLLVVIGASVLVAWSVPRSGSSSRASSPRAP